MAFASVGTIGAAGVETAGGNLVITTSATAEAGNLVLLFIGKDNQASADGTTSEITSVSDSASNTWQSIGRFVNAQGAALAGAYVDVYYSVIANQLASGGTITIVQATDNRDCAARAWEFTMAGGSTVQLGGTVQTLANDGADPGSMTISGLSSMERLYVRAIASESENATELTNTTNYTIIPVQISTTVGVTEANIGIRGEFRILTGTGDSSDPTLFSADHASIYFALEEVAAGGGGGSASGNLLLLGCG